MSEPLTDEYRAPRACPECGHSDRMHRTGASPRYAGCMERVPRKRDGRRMSCWCALTPTAIAQELDDIEAMEPGNTDGLVVIDPAILPALSGESGEAKR